MALMDTLTRKAGPLPVWTWVVGGGVVLGLGYRWYKGRQSAAAAPASDTTPTDSSTTVGSSSPSAASPDVSGLGGTPAVSGGGTSSGGTTSSDTGSGSFGDVGFSTGPAPPPAGYTYDQNSNLIPVAQYQDQLVFDRETQLAQEGLTVNPQTGMIEPFQAAAVTSTPDLPSTPLGGTQAPAGDLGAAQAPASSPTLPTAPPMTSVPATTTAPAAHTTLASGTVLWHGTAVPNLQTIAGRYGLPTSALKVTNAGPAYGAGVHVVSVI